MAYDFDGQWVSPGQFERHKRASFLFDSSLPSWMSLYQSASVTTSFNDLSSSEGALQMDIANANGGVRGPGIDLTKVEACAIRAAFASVPTTGNVVEIGFSGSSTSFDPDDHVRVFWYQNSKYETGSKQGGTGSATSIGPPTGDNEPVQFEIFLRPSETEFVVFGPGGHETGSTYYWEENATYNNSLTMYPAAGIRTDLQATTDSMYLYNFEVFVWQ